METPSKSTLLEKALWVLTAILIILAPTQYTIALIKDIHISVAVPVLGITFCCWLIWQIKENKAKGLAFPPLLICLFLIASALSLFASGNLLNSGKELLQYIGYFIVAFLVFRNPPTNFRERQLHLIMFFAASTVVILVGLVHYFDTVVSPFFIGATFENRNVLGGYLALSLPFLTCFVIYAPKLVFRIWGAILLVGGAIICLTGGAWLGILISLALIGLSRDRLVGITLVTTVLAIVLAATSFLPRDNLSEIGTSIALYNEHGQPVKRYPEWQAATKLIKANTLLGVGLGNYQRNIGQYYGQVPSGAHKTKPDSQNLYLVLAATAGVPAVFLFALGLLQLIWTTMRTPLHAPDRQNITLLAAGSGLLAFTIAAIWSPLLVRGIGIPLAFLLAEAARGIPSNKTENSPETA
jgi:O-antigen ligase